MKKIILLLLVFVGFGTLAQAQTVTKRDAKKVTNEINKNIDQIDKAIRGTDWKEVQKVVDQTAASIEKNAENIQEVLDKVDFDKLFKTMGKMVEEFKENIDTEELRKSVEEVGVKIDEALTQKKTADTK